VGESHNEFFDGKYPLANLFYAQLHYPFSHRRNVSVNKLIRQQSHLVDQMTLLMEYALYHMPGIICPQDLSVHFTLLQALDDINLIIATFTLPPFTVK
jgi:hypothetical protein